MNSKKIFVIGAVIALLLGVSKTGVGQEKATPQEVVQKVRQAADFLSKSGDAGLAQFNQKNGPWVWKDSYLFVFDCAKGTVAGHPFRPDLIGKNGTGLKGSHGIEFSPSFARQERVLREFGSNTGGRSQTKNTRRERSAMA